MLRVFGSCHSWKSLEWKVSRKAWKVWIDESSLNSKWDISNWNWVLWSCEVVKLWSCPKIGVCECILVWGVNQGVRGIVMSPLSLQFWMHVWWYSTGTAITKSGGVLTEFGLCEDALGRRDPKCVTIRKGRWKVEEKEGLSVDRNVLIHSLPKDQGSWTVNREHSIAMHYVGSTNELRWWGGRNAIEA